MSKPTRKLAMAYSTIATMEARIKELECQRPAGVAVPEGWLYRINPDLPHSDWQFTQCPSVAAGFEQSSNVEVIRLSAAPHPVSGEQKAQDVAGLVRAAEFARANICSWIDKYPAASHFNANRAINYLDRALATHRAQQGEQS